MAKADPFLSDGARMERRAITAYLRRQLRQPLSSIQKGTIEDILMWIQGRHRRYDAKKGGLGK